MSGGGLFSLAGLKVVLKWWVEFLLEPSMMLCRSPSREDRQR